MVLSIPKDGSQRQESVLLSGLGEPRGIIVTQEQLVLSNACSMSNGGCEDFCFSIQDRVGCKCRDGYYLDTDRKSCIRNKTCDQFLCHDGQCINKIYICDGHPDCYDNSDEANCAVGNKTTNTHTVTCNETQSYQCVSGECVSWKYVCDGVKSCPDGSDEGFVCNRVCTNTSCSHHCHPSPAGPVCYCRAGYQLTADHVTCTDINECSTHNGLCSQKCSNKNGSHTCSCVDGYKPSNNGSHCLAKGPNPSFVIGTFTDGILQFTNLRNRIDLHVGSELNKIITLDVDQQNRDIYFYSNQGIHKYSVKSKHTTTLKRGIRYVTELGYDWIGLNLYITDENKDRLLACGVKERPLRCKTVLFQLVKTFALYPEKGIMIYINTKKNQIRRASMNGKHSEVIIDSDLSMATNLIIDKPANRMYWIMNGNGQIESATLDGKDRYTVLRQDHHFSSMIVFGDDLYLTDTNTDTLLRLNKMGQSEPVSILSVMAAPSSVKVIHPVLQGMNKPICENLQCQQLCLLNFDLAECACYDGFLLQNRTGCKDMSLLLISPKPNIVTTPSPDNKQNKGCHLPCINGGKCVLEKLENKCMCREDFEGKLCENLKTKIQKKKTHFWIIAVILAVVGLVIVVVTFLYFKYKRHVVSYLRIPCGKNDDAHEGLVSDDVLKGPVFTNGQYQEMDDINYPEDFAMATRHSSSESLDSAFVSKRYDSDTSISTNSTGSPPGGFGYTKI